jgi:dihydrodipicolinate reductase
MVVFMESGERAEVDHEATVRRRKAHGMSPRATC